MVMVSGGDSYGRFKTHVAPTHRQPFKCNNCFGEASVAIQYWPTPPKLPNGIQLKDTILGKNRLIGVTCGCYAKGHRQIARIDERMKARATGSN